MDRGHQNRGTLLEQYFDRTYNKGGRGRQSANTLLHILAISQWILMIKKSIPIDSRMGNTIMQE